MGLKQEPWSTILGLVLAPGDRVYALPLELQLSDVNMTRSVQPCCEKPC